MNGYRNFNRPSADMRKRLKGQKGRRIKKVRKIALGKYNIAIGVKSIA